MGKEKINKLINSFTQDEMERIVEFFQLLIEIDKEAKKEPTTTTGKMRMEFLTRDED